MHEYPNDADGAVLTNLRATGVDMTRPLLIEFPVAVPDESSANRTMKALVDAGYDSEIDFDEGEPNEDGVIDADDDEFGPSWTVYANVRMVPVYDEIIRIQSDLDRLSQPLGGYSDGWGVLIDRPAED